MMVVINYVTTGGHGGYGVITIMYAQQSPSISVWSNAVSKLLPGARPPNLRGPKRPKP